MSFSRFHKYFLSSKAVKGTGGTILKIARSETVGKIFIKKESASFSLSFNCAYNIYLFYKFLAATLENAFEFFDSFWKTVSG
jgi:hypothetical protein